MGDRGSFGGGTGGSSGVDQTARDSAAAADTKATNAASAASAADTKATNAATAASTADTKATNAGTAASAADTKATNAGTAASAADTKAVNAQGTANTALTAATSRPDIPVMQGLLQNRGASPFTMVVHGGSTPSGATATPTSNMIFPLITTSLQKQFPSGLNTEDATVGDLNGAAPTTAGIHTRSGSLSGYTSAQALDTTILAKGVTQKPTVIWLWVESNDFANNTNPATTVANMNAAMDYYDTNLTNPHIFIIVHAHERGDVTNPTYTWSQYGAASKAAAAARTKGNAFYMDLTKYFEPIGIPTSAKYGDDVLGIRNADKIHLLTLGHRIMLFAIFRELGLPAPVLPPVGGASPVTTSPNTVFSFTPPVGWTLAPQSMTAGAAGTPVFQRLSWYPTLLQAFTVDQLQVNVTTAFTGGSDSTLQVGIYGDDGTGAPAFSLGPLAQGSFSLTTLGTGRQAVTLSTPWKIPSAGSDWIVTLVAGTAAPSAGVMTCISNNSFMVGVPASLGPNTTVRGYIKTSVTALPSVATDPTNVSGNADIPVVYVRRSA